MKYWKENWIKILSFFLTGGGATLFFLVKNHVFPFLNKEITVKTGHLLAGMMILSGIIALCYYYYRTKIKERVFQVGQTVILKTQVMPYLVVTGYNPFNNKVRCEGRIKDELIVRCYPEAALFSYYAPNVPKTSPPSQRRSFWER